MSVDLSEFYYLILIGFIYLECLTVYDLVWGKKKKKMKSA